jgi:hypothetical protein
MTRYDIAWGVVMGMFLYDLSKNIIEMVFVLIKAVFMLLGLVSMPEKKP